jgi:hypothetical protein
VAEFFDRKQMRLVSSSWNLPVSPGGIVVNDNPLYFNCETHPITIGSLKFDLTPSDTYPAASKLGERQLTLADTSPVTVVPPKQPFQNRSVAVSGDVWTFGPWLSS